MAAWLSRAQLADTCFQTVDRHDAPTVSFWSTRVDLRVPTSFHIVQICALDLLFQEVRKLTTDGPANCSNCHARKTHSQCLRGCTPNCALREPTLNSCAFRRIVQKRRFRSPRFGNCEIRMFKGPEADFVGMPLFWVELFDHSAKTCHPPQPTCSRPRTRKSPPGAVLPPS